MTVYVDSADWKVKLNTRGIRFRNCVTNREIFFDVGCSVMNKFDFGWYVTSGAMGMVVRVTEPTVNSAIDADLTALINVGCP